MAELFLPLHDGLHAALGARFCGVPAVLGFCPEFWLGFLAAWVFRAGVQRIGPNDNKPPGGGS